MVFYALLKNQISINQTCFFYNYIAGDETYLIKAQTHKEFSAYQKCLFNLDNYYCEICYRFSIQCPDVKMLGRLHLKCSQHGLKM